jgi:hypothetical protein
MKIKKMSRSRSKMQSSAWLTCSRWKNRRLRRSSKRASLKDHWNSMRHCRTKLKVKILFGTMSDRILCRQRNAPTRYRWKRTTRFSSNRLAQIKNIKTSRTRSSVSGNSKKILLSTYSRNCKRTWRVITKSISRHHKPK